MHRTNKPLAFYSGCRLINISVPAGIHSTELKEELQYKAAVN